ncbi:MAG TPA: hypothetical protein VFT61_02340, partial [Sphingomicrobium sp.]|nr:hypothetical protein [Sphingomicrobium sp.]
MNDEVVPARRLAWVKSNRLHNSIALVEHPQDGDPLRHRRDPRGVLCRCRGLLCGLLLGLLALVAASGERQCRNA